MRYFSCLSLVCCALKVVAEKVVVGYYDSSDELAPELLPYNKVTHIILMPTLIHNHSDPTSIDFKGNKNINDIMKYAAAKKLPVLMSTVEWPGSQTFSRVARNETLRDKFIDNLLVFVRKNTKSEGKTPNGWGFDGIDLGLECFRHAAAKCNVFGSDDSANYLIFLEQLRDALDKEFNEHKLLTAPVRVKPFDGPDGKPMTDVSEYAKYFDFVNIMAFDIGYWSKTTGPNAPFRANIAKGGAPYLFTQAIDDWLAAGFPASKLTAGLTFHGRSHIAKTDGTKTHENMCQPKKSETPKGDSSDSNAPNSFRNEETFYYEFYKYKDLREFALSSPNTTTNGYIRHYDNVTQNTWLSHPQTNKFISYDDPQSLKAKVNYAKEKDLRGVMCWEMAMDFEGELINEAMQIRDNKPTGLCHLNEMRCTNDGGDYFYKCKNGELVLGHCGFFVNVCRISESKKHNCGF